MLSSLDSQEFPPYLSCRLADVGDRTGRCFELAYLGLVQADEWELCHGTIRGPGGLAVPHAWLAQVGWVYEAVADIAVPVPEFMKQRGAVGLARYPKHGALRFFSRHKHFGPWASALTVFQPTADGARA